MEQRINFEELSDMTVTIDLEDGTQMECDVVLVFQENDRNYIAVVPIEQKKEAIEADIYFYRLINVGAEELGIENIEEDEEYYDVAERFEEIMDEQEFSDILIEED